jgi:hypothetical protein
MSRRTLRAIVAPFGITLCIVGAAVWAVSAHEETTPTPAPAPSLTTTLDYTPTYYQHIQPIIQANCASCHMEGKFGHDTFEMDTPAEIVDGADEIALAIRSDYMPPWPPGEASPHFLYDRSLSAEAIAQVVAWADAGAPLGDPADAPPPAPEIAHPVVEADIVLEMPAPYTPNQDRFDDYRCFLLDPGFTEPTFITGYDILPDNIGAVHHTVLFPGSPAQRAEADSRNGADGQPGWECFGGTGLSSGGPNLGMMRPLLPLIAEVGGIGQLGVLLEQEDAAAQLDAVIAGMENSAMLSGMIAGVGGTESLVMLLRQGLVNEQAGANQPVTGVIGAWVPGSAPSQFPQNTGLLLPAGGFIIMQMHYNTSANDDPDQSSLILDVTQETGLTAGRVLAINAPVEIPCPDGVTGEQCTREYALAQTGEGSDLLLAICGQTLADYAAQDPSNAISTCDYLVPTSGWAIAIMSHQHKLGQTTHTVLNPDTPDERLLIDIPRWDFDWQGSYWFAEPIWLNENDTIRITCTYDNSVSRTNPEPRYVVAGEGTNDEMCLNFITMLPAAPGTPPPLVGMTD